MNNTCFQSAESRYTFEVYVASAGAELELGVSYQSSSARSAYRAAFVTANRDAKKYALVQIRQANGNVVWSNR